MFVNDYAVYRNGASYPGNWLVTSNSYSIPVEKQQVIQYRF